MALNYPGPYGLRLFYTVYGFEHKQEFNIDVDGAPDPGDDFTSINPLIRAGVSPNGLDDLVDAYAELWADLMNQNNAELVTAELWKYTPSSFDALFISAYGIARAGDNTADVVTASEQIYTFRTTGGGTMRIHFEEGSYSPGAPATYGLLSGQQAALVDYVLGGTSAFIGRDGTFPVGFLRHFPGTNEAAFKRIYRP